MSGGLQNALLAALASVLLAPAPAAGQDAADLRAAIVTPTGANDSITVVLPASDRSDAIDPKKLAEAFQVYADGAGPGALMAGIYAIEDRQIRFTPRFPCGPALPTRSRSTVTACSTLREPTAERGRKPMPASRQRPIPRHRRLRWQ